MANEDKYTLEDEEYTAAQVGKMDDEEYDHLLARANTMNESPDDIKWLMDAREKGQKKDTKAADAKASDKEGK